MKRQFILKRLIFQGVLQVIMLSSFCSSWAQKPDSLFNTSYTVTTESRYIWRGIDCGGPSTNISADIGWRGIHVEFFAGVNLQQTDYQELDLSLYYEWHDMYLGFTDYWCSEYNPSWFRFRMPTTGHTIEAFAGYDFGPLYVSWCTHVAGLDINSADRRQWSSYLELTSADLEWANLCWKASLGIVPWQTEYYDVDGLSVNNVSLRIAKEIVRTDHMSLPVFMQLSANPADEKLYCIVGMTLNL